MPDYVRRVIDTELDGLLIGLPAIGLEGPKGVGKTATAQRRTRTAHRLDEPGVLESRCAPVRCASSCRRRRIWPAPGSIEDLMMPGDPRFRPTGRRRSAWR